MLKPCSQSIKYEEILFHLKFNLLKLEPPQQDIFWLEQYNKMKNNLDNIANLPQMLALIHPDFCSKNGISFIENDILQLKIKSNFTNGIRPTDKCQIEKISGHPCIYEKIRGREKVQADHFWPNSLGGPSILDNRLLLCKYHNSMKSNSISSYLWDTIPTWIPRQLNTISKFKQ